DLGERPLVLDQPEHREQPLVARERSFLVVRQLGRRRRAVARQPRELLQVELDRLEDPLDAIEREAAAREHALHGGLRNAELLRERGVGHAARAQTDLERFDEAGLERHATHGIRFRYFVRRPCAAAATRAAWREPSGGGHMKPISAIELCDAVRSGRTLPEACLDRILRLDAMHGLLEVQGATPWQTIAAELRPGDARARVRTTMPTVGESIARNAAGPDGTPAVAHVACMALVTPEGELRRVSRERDAELFALTVGGQGLFGTLYSVTLKLASLARAV